VGNIHVHSLLSECSNQKATDINPEWLEFALTSVDRRDSSMLAQKFGKLVSGTYFTIWGKW
jgi:hypothetical protein